MIECNIDGLIGPTHHYGGLGVGNVASLANKHRPSNPKQAAIEGVSKMLSLARLGIPQFFLPPPLRPNWQWLHSMGFHGDPSDILKRCADTATTILSAAYSSAFMWTANAATVAPSSDTIDQHLHILPANLCSNLHRGMESSERYHQFQSMFQGIEDAIVHSPLPSVWPLRDEGAANHMRLCSRNRTTSLHLFVYGQDDAVRDTTRAQRFLPRQSKLASSMAANALGLAPDRMLLIEQSSAAIDSGVFHNDVIATSHGNLLLYHEYAFENESATIEAIESRFKAITGENLICLRVSNETLAMEQAVKTYLFNSQIVSLPDGSMHLICPEQCQTETVTKQLIDGWIADSNTPIQSVRYFALQQSMANGGGPACLRLRVDLSAQQLANMPASNVINEARATELIAWIESHYPTQVTLSDMARIDFAQHVSRAAEPNLPVDR